MNARESKGGGARGRATSGDRTKRGRSALFAPRSSRLGPSVTRGIRGAASVPTNAPGAIERTVRELLERIVADNGVRAEDVAAAFFTATPDLDADFPARAARQMGWTSVPLLCAQEIAVPGAPPRIVRVLLLVNTDLAQADVRHVYLGEARRLRPDLVR